MRKIIVGAQVSMDGVMQAPGGPTEDPTKGFKFGGSVMPYFDQVFGEEIDRLFGEKFDLLLGRKTYEIGRSRYELAGLGALARHRPGKAPAGRRRPQSCYPGLAPSSSIRSWPTTSSTR